MYHHFVEKKQKVDSEFTLKEQDIHIEILLKAVSS